MKWFQRLIFAVIVVVLIIIINPFLGDNVLGLNFNKPGTYDFIIYSNTYYDSALRYEGNDLDMELDSKESIIVCGPTSDYTVSDSTAYPVNENYEAIFLSKSTKQGSAIWRTCIGGNDDLRDPECEVDTKDNIIITAITGADDFPLQNANQTSIPGTDSIVAKFNGAGELIWSTYLGGSDRDYIRLITSDLEDSVIVYGYTQSDDFPILNGFDESFGIASGIDYDYFITKFSSQGELVWSSFLSGEMKDMVTDQDNNIILTGHNTRYNPSLEEYGDASIVIISPDGYLVTDRRFGGSYYDVGKALDVDNENNIVITGLTNSFNYPEEEAEEFPHIQSDHFTTAPDYNRLTSFDVFITKFSPSGNIIWSTYFGGDGDDYSFGITVDQKNEIYIYGQVSHQEVKGSFPLKRPYSRGYGESDVFIARFTSEGTMSWCTFFGGRETDGVPLAGNNEFDSKNSIRIANNGEIIITGKTSSPDFPMKVDGTFYIQEGLEEVRGYLTMIKNPDRYYQEIFNIIPILNVVIIVGMVALFIRNKNEKIVDLEILFIYLAILGGIIAIVVPDIQENIWSIENRFEAGTHNNFELPLYKLIIPFEMQYLITMILLGATLILYLNNQIKKKRYRDNSEEKLSILENDPLMSKYHHLAIIVLALYLGQLLLSSSHYDFAKTLAAVSESNITNNMIETNTFLSLVNFLLIIGAEIAFFAFIIIVIEITVRFYTQK